MVTRIKKKQRTAQAQPERKAPIRFRTAGELLFDYVKGDVSKIHRPVFVALSGHPNDCHARMWACVAEGDLTGGADFVCTLVDVNLWVLSQIDVWQSPNLRELLDLSDRFDYFLMRKLSVNQCDGLFDVDDYGCYYPSAFRDLGAIEPTDWLKS